MSTTGKRPSGHPPARAAMLAQFGHEAIGQTVAGVEIGESLLRISFESGAALLVRADHVVNWWTP